ncbi:hypothetical protein A2467_02315 [Candidatus Nomurabacteria bacterium RIFOXYC2_FULL_36_8]|nr:MAG: hypothetical protein A2467_02315 [Candidatus Nomurabacteria bacterium RIFOXYC2_FULL_36_8]
MVTTKNLVELISEKVHEAQNEKVFYEEIYSNLNIQTGKNEFLFFIKPEITVKSPRIKLEDILELILEKILTFGFNIHNIKILSAKYLDKYNIIAQHYGVINKISSNASLHMSESAKKSFKKFYHKDVSDVKVLGGFEFLEMYPEFNARSLDYIWKNLETKKLASGTYCEDVKIDNEIIYLLNGFHPRQLTHFIDEGKSIVTMTLSSNLSWKQARSCFVGSTNPFDANQGSLRRELLNLKDEFGLEEISQSRNGVHLSAGPVEAIVELIRFNLDPSNSNENTEFLDFKFGNLLMQKFSNRFVDIINNINIDVEGEAISIFDITEELDSDSAIFILEKYLDHN